MRSLIGFSALLVVGCSGVASDRELRDGRAAIHSDADKAYQRLAHRELRESPDALRDEIAALVALQPHSTKLRLLAACNALDRGDLTAAATELGFIESSEQRRPEIRLLNALVRRRRIAPTEDFYSSFARAFVEAGSPDLRSSDVLPNAVVEMPGPEQALPPSLSDEDRFLVYLSDVGTTPERATWIADHFHLAASVPLALAAADKLAPEAARPDAGMPQEEGMRSKLAALAAQNRDELALQFVVLHYQTDMNAPHTSSEIEAIERLSSHGQWRKWDFKDFVHTVERRLVAAGVAEPTSRAFMMGVSAVMPASSISLLKSAATYKNASAEDRRRLALANLKIGATFGRGQTLLERMVGLALRNGAAKQLGDVRALSDGEAEHARLRSAMDEQYKAVVDRWPSAVLAKAAVEASLTDEVASTMGFATPVARR